jgi:hypothetical protein
MALSSVPQEDPRDPSVARQEAAQRAVASRQGLIERVGADLMNAWNRGRTDPSDMAMLGHDTAAGYEFCIERDGAIIIVSLARDLRNEA